MKLKNTGGYNLKTIHPKIRLGFDNVNTKIVAVDKKYIDRMETGNYYTTIHEMNSFSKQILPGK